MSFKIGTCKVTVSFFFFILLCLCSLSDKSGVMLSGVFAAILHECAHLAAIFFFRLHPETLSITSAGLQMQVPYLTKNRRICIITAFSGAFFNLILFVLTLPFWEEFAAANLALCILNLLPCDPFDGGIILRAVLEKYLLEKKVDIILFVCTLVILIILVTLGTLILIKSRYNYSLLTLSMLIFTTICQRTLQ